MPSSVTSMPASLIGGVIVAIEPRADEPAVRSIRVRRPGERAGDRVSERASERGGMERAEGSIVVAELLAAHVDELELRLGRRWTQTLALRVAGFAAALAARRDAMLILGRRATSSSRLMAKLVAIGHDHELAATTTAQLAADGWLDDRAHARAIAEQLTSRTALSTAGLAARLRRRGVDAPIADAVAAEVAKERTASGQRGSRDSGRSADLDACRRAAAELLRSKTARTPRDLDASKLARRVAAALGRRGFDPDDIRQTLAESGLEFES